VDVTLLGVDLAKWILGFYSAASVIVMVERAVTLAGRKRAEERGYAAARDALEAAGPSAVLPGTDAPSVAAFRAGLGGRSGGASEERLREAVGRELFAQSLLLQRHLPYLATIASTAPYIGLFGTVLGILSAFRQIAATGQTGPSIVAGGISEALVTTALGLFVAIPAVIAYNQLLARVNGLSLLIETHGMDLLSRYVDLRDEPMPGTRP
jgi:biopolymer transport protein ExbB